MIDGFALFLIAFLFFMLGMAINGFMSGGGTTENIYNLGIEHGREIERQYAEIARIVDELAGKTLESTDESYVDYERYADYEHGYDQGYADCQTDCLYPGCAYKGGQQ